MTNSLAAGAFARPLSTRCPDQSAASIILAAQDLLGHLAAGRRIDTAAIRTAMHSAFGASDAAGMIAPVACAIQRTATDASRWPLWFRRRVA